MRCPGKFRKSFGAAGEGNLPALMTGDDGAPTHAALGALRPGYHPCTFDLTEALPDGRPGPTSWVQIFLDSVPSFRARCEEDAGGFTGPGGEAGRRAAAAAMAERLEAALQAVLADPEAPQVPAGLEAAAARGDTVLPGPDCAQLCKVRDEALRQAGFRDPFRVVKLADSERAIGSLRGVLAELDDAPDARARAELVLLGCLAGNIADLGAQASAERHGKREAFAEARAGLRLREWEGNRAGCGFAEAAGALARGRYRFAVVFVDNHGPDLVLGMLPLARELLRGAGGTARVLLAVNAAPSINDVTVEDRALIERAAAECPELESALGSGRLEVQSTGSDLPVIDLSRLAPDFVERAAGCDLVFLQGMGRGIETNLRAEFTCDSLNMGLVKHPEVAQKLGGELFDCVVHFREPGRASESGDGGPTHQFEARTGSTRRT